VSRPAFVLRVTGPAPVTATVMRIRCALALVLLGVLLLGLTWLIAGSRGSEFAPRATLTLLRYEVTNGMNYTVTQRREVWTDPRTPRLTFTTFARAGADVQTNSQALVARVRLRNLGRQGIGYDTCGYGSVGPRYWCRIQRDGVWAEFEPFCINGHKATIGVGEQLDFSIWFPPDVTAWELVFDCDRPGPKDWAVWRKWLPRALRQVFPDGEPAYAVLRSDTFAVESNAVAGQTRQFRKQPMILHNERPGVDAGWRVLFTSQSPWPRATQAERYANDRLS
jgi:hypothetical protein